MTTLSSVIAMISSVDGFHTDVPINEISKANWVNVDSKWVERDKWREKAKREERRVYRLVKWRKRSDTSRSVRSTQTQMHIQIQREKKDSENSKKPTIHWQKKLPMHWRKGSSIPLNRLPKDLQDEIVMVFTEKQHRPDNEMYHVAKTSFYTTSTTTISEGSKGLLRTINR